LNEEVHSVKVENCK